jgi:hypothetical protein
MINELAGYDKAKNITVTVKSSLTPDQKIRGFTLRATN